MAKVNRYSQINRPRYNPTSLQEMMVAPSYMREQHDAISGQANELEAVLGQYQNLDIHNDLALQEKSRLTNELDAFINDLNTSGFTPQSTQDFTRFRRDFKEATGPQGKLARLQGAMEAMNTGMEESLKNQLDSGWDEQTAKARINQQVQMYRNNFAQTGQINNIQFEGAPQKMNLEEDMTKLRSLLGSTSTKTSGTVLAGGPGEISLLEAGYAPYKDPTTGKIVLRSPSGHYYNSNNDAQISSFLQYLGDKWLKPEGEGARSDAWQGYSMAQRSNDIFNLGASMEDRSTEDMRDVTRTYQNPVEGSEKSLDELRVFTDNIKTGGYGSNYKSVVGNAQTVLNSQFTTNTDKKLATDALLAAAEVDAEWLGSEGFIQAIPEEFRDIYKEVSSKVDLESATGFKLTDINPLNGLAAVERDDGMYDLQYQTMGGMMGMRSSSFGSTVGTATNYNNTPLTAEEVSFILNNKNLLKDAYSAERTFKDERIAQKGTEFRRYTSSEDFGKDQNVINSRNKNLSEILLNPNHHEVKHVSLTDQNGNKEILELNPNESHALLNQLRNPIFNVGNVSLAGKGSTLGLYGVYNTNVGSASGLNLANGKKKLGQGSWVIEIYSPLDDARGTASQEIIDKFPESIRAQVDNYMRNSDLSSIIKSDENLANVENILDRGVPASHYLEGVDRSASLGLLASVESNPLPEYIPGEYITVHTPTIATNMGTRELTWGDVLSNLDFTGEPSSDSRTGDLLFQETVVRNLDGFRELSKFVDQGRFYESFMNSTLDNGFVETLDDFINYLKTNYYNEPIRIDNIYLMELISNMQNANYINGLLPPNTN